MKQQPKYRLARTYQDEALQYVLRVNHPALFMEMGLGKALVAIRAANLFESKEILIVAPNETFFGWHDELQKEHEPPAIELTGSRQARLNNLCETSKWKIINKEGHLALPEIEDVDWDCIILDESTFIKAPEHTNKSEKKKLKRYNVSRFYCKNFRNVQHRMILTGLPAPNHLLNYYQQLKFLNPEILNFKNHYEFRTECFYQYYYDYLLKPSYKVWFYERLAQNCFFLKRKEVGLYIKEISELRIIKYTDEMKRVYKRLSKKFILQYRDEIEKRTKFAPVKLAWLRQLCSGFINKELKFPSKINALIELLEGELKGQPIIVYCQFICEIESIQKRLKNKCRIVYSKIKNRAEIKNDFDNRRFDVLVLQSGCWKFGLNLELVNTMIFFSLPFGLETFEQNKSRIKRSKKKNSVLMIYFILEHSAEQIIYNGLQNSKTETDITTNIIKRILDDNSSRYI